MGDRKFDHQRNLRPKNYTGQLERKEVLGVRREGKKAREGITRAGQKLGQVGSSRNPRDPRTNTNLWYKNGKKFSALYCNGSKSTFPTESTGAIIN